jgi:hypothetical protein
VAISAKFAWSGALFAPSDPLPVSRHSDRLFARVRGVIKDGFADPDFGPREVAVEAGISVHATSSSSSRRAARPAANSYIRFVLITPRTRANFAIGAATRQALTPTVEKCVPVPAKGRHEHTTSGLRLIKSSSQDRSRQSRRIKSSTAAGG